MKNLRAKIENNDPKPINNYIQSALQQQTNPLNAPGEMLTGHSFVVGSSHVWMCVSIWMLTAHVWWKKSVYV